MATKSSETPWEQVADTGNAAVDALISGVRYATKTLTYSFADFGTSTYWSTAASGYGPTGSGGEPWSPAFDVLAPSDRVAAREAMAAWAAVSGLTLTEVSETSTRVGDLRLAYTWTQEMGDAQAYAYLPSSGPKGGDIWFSTLQSNYTEAWVPGSYEYLTVLHEIGHAIGLKHPFEQPGAIDPALDARSYTVMSYSALAGNPNAYFSYEPTTPMVLDIAAIQALYGPAMGTGAGNTTYTFGGNGDYHRTIWDVGGTDTIVYQSAAGGEIDLREGLAGGSTLGKPVQVIDASSGQVLGAVYNVWIAYGTVIENATGGSGADRIIGNGAANRLLGGGGNDTISGGAGADTLNGGAGTDSLVGGSGADTYQVDSALDRIRETSTLAGEIDTVVSTIDWTLGVNLERLTLAGTAAQGTGNALANLITGNASANRLLGGSGNDTLRGAAGNDTLDGSIGNDLLVGGTGSDRLSGGTGSDIFQLDSLSGSDTLTDFASGADRLRLSMATVRIGDGDTLVENAAVRAAPSGFSAAAELVIFGADAASLSLAGAAAAIGSATAAYAIGHSALFVVDNGASTGVFRFVAADANATVSAGELTLLATLSGTSSTAPGDFLFTT